ncbi:hypothetical protein [Phaeovulum veldkampii]|uniref:hypothetical protein n=1 Tax=Phaeovulum veldkampii TaxID=33049 RepID=UPI0010EABF9C|nr:hypothetical protein [Phaeovulum veldkampii]TDQ57122.1 hypothetical protein EV658_11483 [Phaeovulum veldkampii DSM 11550]
MRNKIDGTPPVRATPAPARTAQRVWPSGWWLMPALALSLGVWGWLLAWVLGVWRG